MWPSTLLTLFEAVKWDSGDENDLLGPYNALLDFCFPWEEGWIVVPQFRRPTKSVLWILSQCLWYSTRKPLAFFLRSSQHVIVIALQAGQRLMNK